MLDVVKKFAYFGAIRAQPLWASSCALLVFGVAACAAGQARSEDLDVLPSEVRFNEHIRPLFNEHCIACHGGVKQAAGISFVYKDQVLPPDGWIVEPGDPDSSLLLQRVAEADPQLRMPPPDHGPALSPREIAMLRKWIADGAAWKTSHWAYAAPDPQPLPEVSNSSWIRRPLDRYVLARLDEENLEPSPDAEPDRWLRRVTLDLTGLPPTLHEREEFLLAHQSSPDEARRALVDRLLQSPRYGERWASVWLDQIRYADSQGLGIDSRRSIWKYRDWVIRALNSDMPYDEFTIKQIAGDLLPDRSIDDLIATAAHRLTQTNGEGGTDDEEFRVAAVLDRVDTTWQAWQGVTFGCAQCHSHPYDPFRHEEYYEFAAFFNNTADCDLGEDWPVLKAPIDPQDYEKATRLDRKIEALRNKIWSQEYDLLSDSKTWRPLAEMTATTNNSTRVQVEPVGHHEEFFTVDTVSQNTDVTLEAPLPANANRITAVRLTMMPHDPGPAVSDSEWGFVLSNIDVQLVGEDDASGRPLEIERLIIDEPDPFYDPQGSLNPKSSNGFAAYSRINHPRQAALLLKAPVEAPPKSRLRITLQHRRYILAAFSLVTRRGHAAVSEDDRFTQLLTDKELMSLRARLAKLEQERRQIKSVPVPVMRELPEHLSRPSHVFERGLFLTKGKVVTPGTPDSLPPLPAGEPNRLTLAKWLVSPQNPLTARVAVNRIWARLFGVGLVATEEDFGSSGEPPSHPELLDYLATQFQQTNGWSMKDLMREIVLSRTYAQGSKVSDERYERDPQNRLLSRGPRHRLSAEMVRDQALALAGLLNEKRFGPPVHPPIPDGVWNPFDGGDKWEAAKQGEADRYRRSIYTYTKRSIPFPMFAAFDAPSREFCTPRRLQSNTPLQALMMLNDATFAECATALASRMERASADPREQVRYGFALVTCRDPEVEDVRDLLSLFNSDRESEDASDLTAVAAVLLNLDEVVMK